MERELFVAGRIEPKSDISRDGIMRHEYQNKLMDAITRYGVCCYDHGSAAFGHGSLRDASAARAVAHQAVLDIVFER